MAPEARREMIVDAALPLILEHGERVTTRQIADAAGIAEGTIFRAFADKDDVIAAVVATGDRPDAARRRARRHRPGAAVREVRRRGHRRHPAARHRRLAAALQRRAPGSTRRRPARGRRSRRWSGCSKPTATG